MIDPSYILRKTYYDKLSNIQHDGQTVPYFSNYVPDGMVGPYIVLTAISTGFRDDKGCLETTALVTVEAVTVFDRTSMQSGIQSEMIGNEILKSILPYPGGDFDLAPDFQSIDAKLSNSPLLTDLNDNEKIFRKVISIFHIINQIQNV